MKDMKLIFVSEDNHNKYINIKVNDDNTFTAEWGRVGGKGSSMTYPSSKYNSYVNSKLKKGYEDISHLVKESKDNAGWNIKDSSVLALVEHLINESNQNISDNYVLADNVTQRQIDSVQDKIDLLNLYIKRSNDIKFINESLLDIYKTIPRKMKNTKDYLIESFDIEHITEMLSNEQQMIDNLASNVQVKSNDNDMLNLEDFNLQIEVASDEDRELIKKKTDFRLTNHKVWKVTNTKTEKNFNPKGLKTKLLYHGSRNANYWSILTKGLLIRPTGVPTTGSMFGNGIYGADKARKSIGYTSLSGSYWSKGNSNKAYLCIFEFATGKEWDIFEKGKKNWNYNMGNIDEYEVKRHNCDSVFAEKGVDLRNNEYIVYNSNQCTIRFIIEINA